MIAAIYARKSTEQNGVAEEEKSVTRQIEHARAYAGRKGWTVAGEHVYADDGISGAEFLKRPGFLRLMNAIKPKPPFQALIMSEESRLGREQIETAYALKQIMDAGVRVFFYLEDRERTLDTALDKVMLSLTNFASEMEREKARQRTRDALARKAVKGHVAGGKVYGYINHEVGQNGRRDHVELRLHPEEAEVVRRIFREVAEGRGFSRIAKGLTADGLPSPRRNGWAMTGVREMLFRGLYRGRIVWGKTKWVDKGGTKVKRKVPESEWTVVEAPELRIIEEALWQAAHERLDRTRAAYLRSTGGKLWSRPEWGVESKYLLSGFLLCGVCGGNVNAIKRTSRRGAPQWYYVCHAHRVRGDLICPNSFSAPMADLHGEVVGFLRRDVLTPEVMDRVVRRALELQAESPEAAAARRAGLEAELGRVEAELRRLVDALAAGEALPSIREALAAREDQRAGLTARLAALDGLAKVAQTWDAEQARERLTDWQGLLEREAPIARQVLRKLLSGRLVVTPRGEGTARYCEVSGTATYGRVLAGLVGVKHMVPPG